MQLLYTVHHQCYNVIRPKKNQHFANSIKIEILVYLASLYNGQDMYTCRYNSSMDYPLAKLY